ncbi:MAG: hypothetical protein CL693_12800 [Cellvibrionaceae bacterium]|nr:hypothetical protein [Cellvibrionaceae bacterium]|tara:strand:+ start:9461 stop:10429 length:969 start_codon:yes stop_codon:yes gene_type:complete
MFIRAIRYLYAVILCVPVLGYAEVKYPEAVIPESVVRTNVTIWSDGRALDADLYRPVDLAVEAKVPAIVTSHGWGGNKKTASRYAVKFAEQGFIVITFTHSTWGDSGGNLFLSGDSLKLDTSDKAEVNVHEVRNLVDPIDWIQNVRSAVDYLEGEANVDADRIGVWGTSFGGGVVLTAASTDERVIAMVSQVGAFPVASGPTKVHAKQRAVDIARGALPPVPEDLDAFPGLDGTPNLARFLQYDPVKAVENIRIPTLIISAENEQFFKNEDHSNKVYKLLKQQGVESIRYQMIKGIDHYGIYFDGYNEGSNLALEWFSKYLK